MGIKRVFLIVLDSFGIGELPDAASYGDEGSSTIDAVSSSERLIIPNLQKLGLYNIEGVYSGDKATFPLGSFARLAERSAGKDTTIGHWEISGVVSTKPLPTYPNGFPKEIIKEYEKLTGHKIICNRPYSGTDVLRDFGKQQIQEDALIVYTSADSVFQVAAHEDTTGLNELYRCCEIARKLMTGEHAVGRIIARPFTGRNSDFTRTSNRHDYSLPPAKPTMLNVLEEKGFETIGVGKIYDIFAGSGVSQQIKTRNNSDGMNKILDLVQQKFTGLCFANLVDFDMLYGHRNDIEGYAIALSTFDRELLTLIERLDEEDVLMITADHGCDPSTAGTDHTREYVPLMIYGSSIRHGVDLGTRKSFADIAATILDMFRVNADIDGESFWMDIKEFSL